MMLVSMILDPEACISDAGFVSVGRTNGQADPRSWMHVSRMHVSRMHVNRMHVSRMHVSMVHVYITHVYTMYVSMILAPVICV